MKSLVSDETFKMRAKVCPQLHSLRELRKTLSGLKLTDLAVGSDDRITQAEQFKYRTTQMARNFKRLTSLAQRKPLA